MKKSVIVAVSLAAVVAVIYFSLTMGEAKALNVRDVGGDPLSYSGTIRITGIMAGVSQDRTLFGLMDVKELQCTTPNCNKLIIPVSYQGKQPQPGDEMVVTGSFAQTGQGIVFQAKETKVLRNHRIGG